MSTPKEDIMEQVRWIKKNVRLQSLYSIVHTSIREIEKTEDKGLQERIKNFEDNMISLINLILGNDIPPPHLTRYLILLIHKVLSIKDAAELANIKISGINKNTDQIINSMNTLYRLCQEQVFRSAMCDIQGSFIIDCKVDTESPARNLRGQLRQFNLSKNESDPRIQTIKSEIAKADQQVEEVEKFCASYKVSP